MPSGALPAMYERGHIPVIVTVYYEDRRDDGELDSADVLLARSKLCGHLCYHLSGATATMINAYLGLVGGKAYQREQIRSATAPWIVRPRPRGPVQVDGWVHVSPDDRRTLDRHVHDLRLEAARDLLSALLHERAEIGRIDGVDILESAAIRLVRSTLVYAGYEHTLELDPRTGTVVGSSDEHFELGFPIPDITPVGG